MSSFTHFNDQGRAKMVDISEKRQPFEQQLRALVLSLQKKFTIKSLTMKSGKVTY